MSEPFDNVEDPELVRRFVAGDEAAFNEIMRRHRQLIYNVTARILNSPPDAEEITQDTFIRAHRALKSFRGESSLTAWLYRIATNLSRNRYWYLKRRGWGVTCSIDATIDGCENATFAEALPHSSLSPAEESELAEASWNIADTMAQLPADHLRILTLRAVEHRSYNDIAAILSLNAGTVKSRLSRAREQLRRHVNFRTMQDLPLSTTQGRAA